MATIPRRPAWYKADQNDKDDFTISVYENILGMEVPESLKCSDPCCQERHHSEERDSFVIDLMSCVFESSHQCIPMTGGSRPGRQDCPIEKSIPGWKEMVDPYREDAVFWHSVWQSAGRPRDGVPKQIMSGNQNQYHYAIRRVKKISNSLRAKNLLQASETSSCNLLKEMKKVKGSKKVLTVLEVQQVRPMWWKNSDPLTPLLCFFAPVQRRFKGSCSN